MKKRFDEDSIIIEFRRIGNSVRVSAMDPQTLTEVTVVGDAKALPDHLKRLAVRKLEYMLNGKKPMRRKSKKDDESNPPENTDISA